MPATSNEHQLLGRLGALGLLVVGVTCALLVWILHPRVFPYSVGPDWEYDQNEAQEVALERLRDFGQPIPSAYVVTTNFSSDPLETRFLRSAPEREVFLRSRLRSYAHGWVVRVYRDDADNQEWSYQVVLGSDGTVLGLQQGVPNDYANTGELSAETAEEKARLFLMTAGVDLADYESPVVRTVDRPQRRDLYLRYRDKERLLDADLSYGLEVRFAGDELTGFRTWTEDPAARDIDAVLRTASLLQTAWVLVPFVLLPPLAILFVRRYHRGVVGVRRGVHIFILVFVAFTLVQLMTVRATAEGSAFGNLNREQVTFFWGAVQIAIYLPALAALAFMAWSVGESWSKGMWRRKLASFDGLASGNFANDTVASASLRGVVAGLALTLASLAFAGGLQEFGGVTLGSWQIAQWQHAAFPGLAVLLLKLTYTLAYGLFTTVLLLPPLVERFGPWAAGAAVALVTGIAFFPPLVALPIPFGLPLWVGAAAATVFLYLRYDLLTALLAQLVAAVLIQALPLMQAADPGLQFQGWLAVGLAALPMFLSLRFVTSKRVHAYQFEDVPPHVRRIAERERQRVELETARNIQASILPDLPEQLHGCELAHRYLPASEVGGDFYDVMALDDGRLAVAIGDVAGHGVSSGLIMSMARSALAVQVTFRPEVRDVMTALNRVVYQSARRRLLTTLCYMVIDPKSGSVEYASAGHLFPYRVNEDGDIRALESVAYPLGVRESLLVEQRSASLEARETLFLSSDGLVEARRLGTDEMFGFDRLEESLVRHAHRGASGLLNGVLEDLDIFVGAGRVPDPATYHRDDDLTALAVTLP